MKWKRKLSLFFFWSWYHELVYTTQVDSALIVRADCLVRNLMASTIHFRVISVSISDHVRYIERNKPVFFRYLCDMDVAYYRWKWWIFTHHYSPPLWLLIGNYTSANLFCRFSKCITWPNIPQLKLVSIQGYTSSDIPQFSTWRLFR